MWKGGGLQVQKVGKWYGGGNQGAAGMAWGRGMVVGEGGDHKHEHGHTCMWQVHMGMGSKHVTKERGNKCGEVGGLQVQKVGMVGET